jgi:hypothetical protein
MDQTRRFEQASIAFRWTEAVDLLEPGGLRSGPES